HPTPQTSALSLHHALPILELVDFSQVKTIEVGYRNSPKNKVDKEAVMLTDDENIIDIQFAVQYNLKSAEAFVFNNRKPDQIAALDRKSTRLNSSHGSISYA